MLWILDLKERLGTFIGEIFGNRERFVSELIRKKGFVGGVSPSGWHV